MENNLKYYVFETAVADGQQASANQSVSYSLTMILDTWGNEVIKESYMRPDETQGE